MQFYLLLHIPQMNKDDYLSSYLQQHPFFQRADILRLDACAEGMSLAYEEHRTRCFSLLNRGVWSDAFAGFSALGPLEKHRLSFDTDVLSISSAHTDAHTDNSEVVDSGAIISAELEDIAKLLIPWRKGPWKLAGYHIDSEWRSDFKYSRLYALLPLLRGSRVADIGGGNGYYAFRLSLDGAKSVVCFDPSEKFFFQFELIQKYVQRPEVQFEIAGYEEARGCGCYYDVVLCMGVLYHQKHPLKVLESCRDLLVKDGTLILESMVYDASESVVLFPEDRYAKARNVYFLPSVKALCAMLTRTGFDDINIVSVEKTDLDEQRSSKHMPFESLSQFLDPNKPELTVEGYPAPLRAVVSAKKRARN